MLRIITRYIKRHRGMTIASLALAGLLGVAASLVPGSSYFTSSTTASASARTGYAELSQNNPGVCALAFGEIDPGQTATVTCTLKNTGTVPLDIAVTGLAHPTMTGGSSPDLSLLSAQIDGFVAFQPVASYAPPVAIGHLGAGAQYTYTFRLKLDPTAGNEWSKVSMGADVTFSGTQSH